MDDETATGIVTGMDGVIEMVVAIGIATGMEDEIVTGGETMTDETGIAIVIATIIPTDTRIQDSILTMAVADTAAVIMVMLTRSRNSRAIVTELKKEEKMDATAGLMI
jgi:hypothetical protein